MVTIPPALLPFLTLDGRLSRHEANTFKLGLYGAGGALAATSGVAGMAVGFVPVWEQLFLDAAKLVVLFSIIPNIRRLHDRGKSGWWLLLFSGMPWLTIGTVLFALSLLPPSPPPVIALSVALTSLLALIAALGIMLWGAVELTMRSGTPGPNKYGLPTGFREARTIVADSTVMT
ncbi:MAG: DUF805 domain-containing protein [Pseudomonadota bacterium]